MVPVLLGCGMRVRVGVVMICGMAATEEWPDVTREERRDDRGAHRDDADIDFDCGPDVGFDHEPGGVGFGVELEVEDGGHADEGGDADEETKSEQTAQLQLVPARHIKFPNRR